MSVYLQKGSPYYLIEFVYRGRRTRLSSETTDKQEAKRRERKHRQEAEDLHHLGKVPDRTWGEAIQRYLRDVIAPKKSKERTGKATGFLLTALTLALGEKTLLSDISQLTIEDYRSKLIAEGLATATVNKHLAFIKAILRRAQEWQWLRIVPRIKLAKLNNERTTWVTKEQEGKLLGVLREDLRDLVSFMLDTGARLGEAVGLSWPDVDLEREYKGGRGLATFRDTKNGETRSVWLSNRAHGILSRLKQERASLDVVAADKEVVFLRQDPPNTKRGHKDQGKWRRWTQPYRLWKSALEKAGLPEDLRLHDLRHTFASNLVMKNAPIQQVSKLLGHKSLKMTQRYAHLSLESLGGAIASLND